MCKDSEELIRQSTLVMAGAIDTTAAAVSWALLELARQPDLQDQLAEELKEAYGNFSRAPLLNAFVQETFRLHCTIPFTSRVALEDDLVPLAEPTLINGAMSHVLPIRAGEVIAISYDLLNVSERIWGKEALEFRPERWLDKTTSQRPPRLATFSEGPMSCPGFRFAEQSVKVQLRELLSRFELRDPPSNVGWSSNIVRRPCLAGKSGSFAELPLTIRRREVDH